LAQLRNDGSSGATNVIRFRPKADTIEKAAGIYALRLPGSKIDCL
jgi:hypothetical protein